MTTSKGTRRVLWTVGSGLGIGTIGYLGALEASKFTGINPSLAGLAIGLAAAVIAWFDRR